MGRQLTSPPPPPSDVLRCRVHGPDAAPTLVYLPGIHGDWTLIGRLRQRFLPAVRWIEFTYPRDPAWTLNDYASGIRTLLEERGIHRAWVLAESFGSQVAWPLLADPAAFVAQGLILAGGFGAYPSALLLRLGRWVAGVLPLAAWRAPLQVYAWVGRKRIGPHPELAPDLEEFLQRRTPEDLRAVQHRMTLIAGNHPEPLAQKVRCPTYYLTGLMDPIVPWPTVPRWLRRHCPGFAGWRIVPCSDHAVLVNATSASAIWIRRWARL